MNKNIARVISSIKRNSNRYSADPTLFIANGKIQITDGVRVLRTEEAGFEPETTNEVYKTEKFYPTDYADTVLEAPSVKELKAMRDDEKMKYRMRTGKKSCDKRVIYQFENGYALNIEYLIDGINATGSNKLYFWGRTKPCLFKSDNDKTDYLLCPINISDERPKGVYLV